MEDSNSIHARAYFNLLKTESWIDEKIKDSLKPFNLTHAQLNVLHILFEILGLNKYYCKTIFLNTKRII